MLKSDPGIVTEKNHKVCYKMFPFDDLLYEEGKILSNAEYRHPGEEQVGRGDQSKSV